VSGRFLREIAVGSAGSAGDRAKCAVVRVIRDAIPDLGQTPPSACTEGSALDLGYPAASPHVKASLKRCGSRKEASR
jgi:hypothetical protein